MIVSTMNADEIYSEIMRDYKSLAIKGKVTCHIFHQQMIRKRLQHEFRSITYKTLQRNEWQIQFQLYTGYMKTGYYIKARDNFGVVAYSIQFADQDTENEERFVIKFNSHFFERYNERMSLGLKDAAKIICYFFKNNFDFDIGQSQLMEDGTRYIHFIFKDGMGIGWQDDAKKTLHIKTFIAKETFTNTQISLAEHIKRCNEEESFNVIIGPDHLKNKI